jgi:DNA helicase-2/ATP-dependent DNA helicase PcrA
VSQTEKVLISSAEGVLPVIDILEDEQQEARIIASAALSNVVNGNYADIAVLARTNKQLQVIKDTFDTFNIPAEIINNAEDVFKKTDIRNLFAYLELLVNPKDDHAFRKAINFPETRLTSAELARLQLIAIDCECSLFESLPKFEGSARKFTSIMSHLEIIANENPGAAFIYDNLAICLDVINKYSEQGRSLSKGIDIATTSTKLDAWCSIQRSLGEDASISSFLKWLHIRDIQDKLLDHQNRVKLMTVHAAKGLEFESVFIAGMNQGCFPSRRGDIEEERRLFYVAITRAKRNLYICRTQNVDAGHGGGYMSMPSQFIGEMQAP